jgi:hypothetical protein
MGVSIPAGAVRSSTRSLIPGRVEFRGMPNHRWWDFENGQIDFGGHTNLPASDRNIATTVAAQALAA